MTTKCQPSTVSQRTGTWSGPEQRSSRVIDRIPTCTGKNRHEIDLRDLTRESSV